jgi:hypothetical protein
VIHSIAISIPIWIHLGTALPDARLCSCGRKADVSRRGRWEAAYLDLLLGANQRLTGEEPLFLGASSCQDYFRFLRIFVNFVSELNINFNFVFC